MQQQTHVTPVNGSHTAAPIGGENGRTTQHLSAASVALLSGHPTSRLGGAVRLAGQRTTAHVGRAPITPSEQEESSCLKKPSSMRPSARLAASSATAR